MRFEYFTFLAFFGAVAIFIYGIRLARTGVQALAGDRLRVILAGLTENRIMALGIGALVTLILQSSNATAITLVGFVASGVMTLTQAMGVMLGADIGSTVVVILLSIKEIATYSLILLILGIVVDLLYKSKRGNYFSRLLMGFGFIFFGMKLMVLSTQPLQYDPIFQNILAFLADRPFITFAATIVFTIFVQNSAAPIGLAIALSFSGLINLPTAIPIILGANVGTCSGSIFASLGSNTFGRQVALAHLMVKSFGALLAFIFFSYFLSSIQWVGGLLSPHLAVGGQIALGHLLFNLYLVILFTPLIRPGAWLIRKFIPQPRRAGEEKFRPLYLDKEALGVPSLAFANVRRELLRMLDLNKEMFRDCLPVLQKNDRILLEIIESQDDQVDLLDKEIKFYLAKLSQENLTDDQAEMELRLVEMTATLEEIGDVINRNILELAEKKIRKGRKFTTEGWKELSTFHGKIMENFQIVAASLATEDSTLAKKQIRHHESLGELERECRQGHLMRLHKGGEGGLGDQFPAHGSFVKFLPGRPSLGQFGSAGLPKIVTGLLLLIRCYLLEKEKRD